MSYLTYFTKHHTVSFVVEYWKQIYENSEEYIYNILYDVPYFDDFTKPIYNKLSQGVKIKSIFYEKAMVSSSRGEVVKKLKKFIDSGDIQRMMTKKSVFHGAFIERIIRYGVSSGRSAYQITIY